MFSQWPPLRGRVTVTLEAGGADGNDTTTPTSGPGCSTAMWIEPEAGSWTVTGFSGLLTTHVGEVGSGKVRAAG
jgi:hypothetical protein